jgi:RNA polymerase sigma-70 factor (ECF subfamily)
MFTAQPAPRAHGDEPSWANLIHRVGHADQEALGELYDATSPTVLGLIQRIVQDFSAAEEITLDVYSQVWRLAPTYCPDKGSPLTWLVMLARSRAIDHLRSHPRHMKEKESPLEAAFDRSDPDPDPEAAAISRNRRQVIQSVFAELTPQQVTLLELAFFEGLSHNEIANKTGIPLGTIKSRIRSAMLRMRELLAVREGVL